MNIEVKELDFTYPGGVVALSSVSVSIQSGEQVAIVGQNGSGRDARKAFEWITSACIRSSYDR